ncbi:isoprenylcysteine carboxylmethyltransferase family protein [Deltaproteobacteria bacterium TL4]
MILYTLFVIGIALSYLYERRIFHALNNRLGDTSRSEWREWVSGGFYLFYLGMGVVEVYWFDRTYYKGLGAMMLLGWGLSLYLKLWVSGIQKRYEHNDSEASRLPIEEGPYRYTRYPLHLVTMLEVFCIPLVHTAYLTTTMGTILYALRIRRLIHNEGSFFKIAGNRL